MLSEGGTDLQATHRDVQADDTTGHAHWEARYTFSTTGRKVHNIIEAEFQFQAGRIAVHHDRFNFWGWSSQALGPTGILLGWTPFRARQGARHRPRPPGPLYPGASRVSDRGRPATAAPPLSARAAPAQNSRPRPANPPDPPSRGASTRLSAK